MRRLLCFGGGRTRVDRGVFWLHHGFTFWTLCFLALFIGLRQCFGDPIDCNWKTLSLNSHCWNFRTYVTNRSLRNLKRPYLSYEDDGRVYLKGYQYYYLVLVVQAVGFALPGLVWRGLEGRLMRQLTCKLNHPYLHPEVRDKKKKQVVEYIRTHLRRNSFYLFFYLVSELLCLVNVVVQLVLTNYFLDGAFGQFPHDLIRTVLSGRQDRTDPLSSTFARSSFCQYDKPGSDETILAPCALPHNSFNELACVLVWYWTAGLAAVTAALILYHFFELTSSKLRLFALKRRARLLDRACLEKVLLDAGLGDWFLLMLLCRNLDAVHLSDVFQTLADDLGKLPLDNTLVCYPTRQVVDQVQRSASMV